MIHQNFHNVVTLKGALNNTIVSCPRTMVVSWLFLVREGYAYICAELININCTDARDNEDNMLMLMNVVPVVSDIIQNKIF